MDQDTWNADLERLRQQAGQVRELAEVGYPKLGILRNAVSSLSDAWRRQALELKKTTAVKHLDEEAASILHGAVRDAVADLDAIGTAALNDDFQVAAERLRQLSATARIVNATIAAAWSSPVRRPEGGLGVAVAAIQQQWKQIELELERENTAATSISRLEALVDEAREATGVVAQGALSEAFDDLSAEERTAAGRFRVGTLALVTVSALTLVLPPLIHLVSGFEDPANDPLLSLIGRLAFSAAVGGAAAYCARQASHHRRIHVWAKSISTQLRSLNAFIAPVNDDGVRNAIIEATARRMLSEPPQSSKQSESQTDATSLLQLAADIARRPAG